MARDDDTGRDQAPVPLILGCVSRKRSTPAAARDLYTSPLFTRRRRYAERSGRPWVIFSAEYGIVDPETVLAPYDTSLKAASPARKRAMGERAAGQLAERFGPLAGRTFEIHAGSAYVESLRPALARRGARLVNPLDGLRIGEQLHWYDVHAGVASPTAAAPAEAMRAAPASLPAVEPSGTTSAVGRLTILGVEPLQPFTYRWPANVEAFDRGWDFTVQAGPETAHVRAGAGGGARPRPRGEGGTAR